MTAQDASKLPNTDVVRPLAMGDFDACLLCYQAFLEGKTSYVVRGLNDMAGRLKEHLLDSFGFIAMRSGSICGYALCYVDHDVLYAEELVYADHNALSSLLFAMGSHQKAGEMRVTIPLWDQLPTDWPITFTKEDYAMVRIIGLDGLSIPTEDHVDGEVRFYLKDDYLTWQEGTYCAKAKDGRVTFTKVDEPAQHTIDILWLSEAVSGSYCTAAEENSAHSAIRKMLNKRDCMMFEKY